MNERIEHCLYQAGLTAQGCWDELDDYAKEGIEKFAHLIVKECAGIYEKIDNGNLHMGTDNYLEALRKHFGVEK